MPVGGGVTAGQKGGRHCQVNRRPGRQQGYFHPCVGPNTVGHHGRWASRQREMTR